MSFLIEYVLKQEGSVPREQERKLPSLWARATCAEEHSPAGLTRVRGTDEPPLLLSQQASLTLVLLKQFQNLKGK